MNKAKLELQISALKIKVEALTASLEIPTNGSFHQRQVWRKNRAILNNMIKKLKKDIALLPQLTIFDHANNIDQQGKPKRSV